MTNHSPNPATPLASRNLRRRWAPPTDPQRIVSANYASSVTFANEAITEGQFCTPNYSFPPASKSGLLAAVIFQGDPRLYEPRCEGGHPNAVAWASNLQTTNLGVGSSNLSGRAS